MRAVIAAILISCAPSAGAIVHVPIVATTHDATHDTGAPIVRAGPSACADPWAPDGATERVVVVCGAEVRRDAFDKNGDMIRAVAPALEPARERVCACAARMTPPPHVDLAVRSSPDEGRATVELADPEDDLDPTLGPDFVACVGTVVTTFAPFHLDACPTGGNAVLLYPVRVDLGAP
jgi:hypothetical protein